MTAILPRVDAPPAPTSRPVFVSVLAVTALVALATVALPPSDAASVTIVVLVIAFLGIPHGAVDHLVAVPPASVTPTPSARLPRSPMDGALLRFHVGYLAAMAAYGLVWLFSPGLALAGFLVLSVHHFGQSDLAYLRIEQRRQIAAQISRGLFLVAVPLVAHLATVAPVVERLGGVDPTSWSWLAGHTAAWCVFLIGQHIAVGLVVAAHIDGPSIIIREVVAVAALTALFVLADPLIGFAVYFGLWLSVTTYWRRWSGGGSVAGADRTARPRCTAKLAADSPSLPLVVAQQPTDPSDRPLRWSSSACSRFRTWWSSNACGKSER